MRVRAVLVALSLLGGAAQAQEAAPPVAPAAPPTLAAPPAGARVEPRQASSLGGVAADKIAEFERSLEFVYAEVEALRRERQMGPTKLLAIGTGAGVGLVVGSVISGVVLVPTVTGMAVSAGLPLGWAEAVGATVRTITTVAFTLGGGSVGQALVD